MKNNDKKKQPTVTPKGRTISKPNTRQTSSNNSSNSSSTKK